MSAFFKRFFAVIVAAFTAFASLLSVSIEAQKHDLVIDLSSNPSTGCSWVVEIDNESVIKAAGSKYIQKFSAIPVSGAGGTEKFFFDAVSDGEAVITFTYGQHWEGGQIFTKVIYRCVSKGGKISVVDSTETAAEKYA